MADHKSIISKLEIIKEMAPEASVKQICGVLIEYIQGENKEGIGFKK